VMKVRFRCALPPADARLGGMSFGGLVRKWSVHSAARTDWGDERPPSPGAFVAGSMISAAVCTDHYP